MGPERPPFQYSLRALLLLPVFVAVACSLLFSSPFIVSFYGWLLCNTVFPAVLTTVLVYGRGYRRTFALGALFPAGVIAFFSGFVAIYYAITLSATDELLSLGQDTDHPEIFFRTRCVFAATWLFIILSGFLCLVVRWVAENRGPELPRERPTDPFRREDTSKEE